MRLSRFIRQDRGTAAVEMAIILPILLLFVFGALEYGWMFTKNGEVMNAARNGVRVGVRADATRADIDAAIDAVMNQAGLAGSSYQIQVSPADPTTLLPGESLTVEVQVPYGNIELTGLPFLPVPTNLAGEASMAREGA